LLMKIWDWGIWKLSSYSCKWGKIGGGQIYRWPLAPRGFRCALRGLGCALKKLQGCGREGFVRGRTGSALAMEGRRCGRKGALDRGGEENMGKETTRPAQRQCSWFLSSWTRRPPGVLHVTWFIVFCFCLFLKSHATATLDSLLTWHP
jgi:hypothetical protein